MKTEVGIVSLMLMCLVPAAGLGAVVAPSTTLFRASANRTFNARGRTFNSSFNSSLNASATAFPNVSLGRAVNGVAALNVVGMPSTSPANTSFNASFNSMFNSTGNRSFNTSSNGTFNATGSSLSPFFGNGILNTPVTSSPLNTPISNVPLSVPINGTAFPMSTSPGILGGGGYGDDYNGGPPETAASTVLNGESQVINAEGNYNRNTAAAAKYAAEATDQAMKNQVDWVRTYYAKRELARADREKERGPRPTMEEVARWARAAAPGS